MDFAAAELEAVQSRLLALEAEKNSLAARLEANRQEAAASSEVCWALQSGHRLCRLHGLTGSMNMFSAVNKPVDPYDLEDDVQHHHLASAWSSYKGCMQQAATFCCQS